MSQDITNVVKERYGAAARSVGQGKKTSCCGGAPPAEELAGLSGTDPICRDIYGEGDAEGLPQEALLASFGCGNPTALAELAAGEVVLDLGSGGGIDVLLSARRVGPTGKAYGLDMTDEMLELAERNRAQAGVENVEFLKGAIDAIPLPDDSVDVIISNCVINLAADKDRVLQEAFRVLRPGGRFAVSDMVVRSQLEPATRASVNLWTGCVSGALVIDDYIAKLEAAGFEAPGIEITRSFTRDDARTMAAADSGCCGSAEAGATSEAALDALAEKVASAFIRARKPAPAA